MPRCPGGDKKPRAFGEVPIISGGETRASFLRGPSRPEGPRASRWCVAPLRGPHARRHPPTRVWSSPLRGVPSDCVRWVGTGALARRATALRSAARCAGTPRLQECFGGLRASRKSSHSSPKLQVISRKVGDLLRRSSTVAGSGVVSRPGACCFLSKWLANSHSFPTARCHHRPMAGACKHTNKGRSLWGARSRFLTAPSLCWISHPRQGNRQPMRLPPRSAHNRWLNGIPRAWTVSSGDQVHRPMAGIRSHLRHIVLTT